MIGKEWGGESPCKKFRPPSAVKGKRLKGKRIILKS